MDVTMVRPRPNPSWEVRSLSRWNGWKMRPASSGLTTGPVLATVNWLLPAMVRVLLGANPAINAKDACHGGTALGWCIFGSLYGWRVGTGEFAAVAELLLAAGEQIESDMLPTRRDDLDRVLRAHLARP